MARIKYKSGYKYQLTEEYTHIIDLPDVLQGDWIKVVAGMMCISKGYAWDGASGPTIDSESSMRASLVHDALYQLMREKKIPTLLRKYADTIFYDLCLEDGMGRIRATLW